MRILDRYVLKSVLNVFLTCLFTFIFLYVIIDLFSHLDEILKQKTGLYILARYYLSYLPIIFIQVSPISCLLATLYTLGRLNHDNELIAMRACGLSVFQIIKTLVILGLIISILSFWVNDKFVPRSNMLNQRIKEQIETSADKTQKKEAQYINNLSMYGLKNRLFFIAKFHPAINTMEGITILEHDEQQNMTKKIVAVKGAYKDGLWKFYQSVTYDFDENGQVKGEPQYFQEETMVIPETPHDFLTQRQRVDFMSIAQINDYIWKLSKSGAAAVIRNLKVDLYQRFSAPLTNLIIILLGIPFSVKMKRRSGGLASVGLSIVMGFLYYVLTAVSIAVGKAGLISPIISASLSHIIALTCGLYMIYTLP